jgi:hypothetical protein
MLLGGRTLALERGQPAERALTPLETRSLNHPTPAEVHRV